VSDPREHARELLAKLQAGIVEQDRLREEYEQARRARIAIQQEIARAGRRPVWTIEFTIHF
jgi:hypothetical protein